LKETLGGAVDAGAAGEEALAGLGEGLTRIVAEDGGCEFADAGLAKAKRAVERRVEALGEVVDALGEAMEKHGDAALGAVGRRGAGEALPGLEKLEACGALEAMLIRGEVLGDLVLRLGDELGGCGRRGCAEVGGEVGDGEVGLVADGRNNG